MKAPGAMMHLFSYARGPSDTERLGWRVRYVYALLAAGVAVSGTMLNIPIYGSLIFAVVALCFAWELTLVLFAIGVAWVLFAILAAIPISAAIIIAGGIVAWPLYLILKK